MFSYIMVSYFNKGTVKKEKEWIVCSFVSTLPLGNDRFLLLGKVRLCTWVSP